MTYMTNPEPLENVLSKEDAQKLLEVPDVDLLDRASQILDL